MNVTKDTSFHSEAKIPVPPVQERPVCPGCGKPRKVWRIEGQWHYTGYDYFCTLRCATAYANKDIADKIKSQNK